MYCFMPLAGKMSSDTVIADREVDEQKWINATASTPVSPQEWKSPVITVVLQMMIAKNKIDNSNSNSNNRDGTCS